MTYSSSDIFGLDIDFGLSENETEIVKRGNGKKNGNESRFYAGDRNNNSQRLTDTFVKYVQKTAKKQKKQSITPTKKPTKTPTKKPT